MIQILLLLEEFFKQGSNVEDLFCVSPSGFEPSIRVHYPFGFGFKSVQDDFQHEFARMTDEAISSVVPTEL